jgi:hypothetical protein
MPKLPWPSVAEPSASDIAVARTLLTAARHTSEVVSRLIARGLDPSESLGILSETHRKLAEAIGRKHLWAAIYNGRILTEVIAKNEQEAREKANTQLNAICSSVGFLQYQAWIPHAEYKDLGVLKG